MNLRPSFCAAQNATIRSESTAEHSVLWCSGKTIALLNTVNCIESCRALGAFFNILLVVKNANTDLPLYSFCIEFLLGSKYVGLPRNLNEKTWITSGGHWYLYLRKKGSVWKAFSFTRFRFCFLRFLQVAFSVFVNRAFAQ